MMINNILSFFFGDNDNEKLSINRMHQEKLEIFVIKKN